MQRQRHSRRPAPTRMLALTAGAALLALTALSSGAARAQAGTTGGYVAEDGRWVRYPRRYLLTGTRPAPPREIAIEVPVQLVTPPPPPPPPVVVRVRDPYDTKGLVVVGAGIGGLMIRAEGRTLLAPSYQLHLGLAVGAAEFALRMDLAPDAISIDDSDTNPVSIFAPRASFNYRFLPQSFVHPVAGAGLEAIIAAPRQGRPATAFAATARVGLELAFPLSEGALAVGLDSTGHLPFACADAFPTALSAMLSFGTHLDYRF